MRQAGDNLVVTLDNGDVWEQSAPATSQLNLRPGDVVQLDRELGGWFLSNRYGDNIQGQTASAIVMLRRGWCALLLISAMSVGPAFAQQKTGPGVPEDDSLDVARHHSVWQSSMRVSSTTRTVRPLPRTPAGRQRQRIVRSNDYGSPVGVTPSNMGQSRVGLQGTEGLIGDWSAVFQVESFFNPQSGQIADALKSLAENNGKAVAQQRIGVDGSSAGQAFQTASRRGALGALRRAHLRSPGGTLLSEAAMIRYDPNFLATAFGVLGASNTYAGAGSSETNRLDDTVKYLAKYDAVHLGAMYKFNDSSGSASTAYQADIGTSFAGASVDAFYSKINDAITGSSLSAPQVAELPGTGLFTHGQLHWQRLSRM